MTTGMKQLMARTLAPRLLCPRPSLALANPCRIDGCKHEAGEGSRLCSGHQASELRRYERRKQQRRARWGAGGDEDG